MKLVNMLIFAGAFFFAGCRSVAPPATPLRGCAGLETLQAVTWVQTSAEYRAIANQTYTVARGLLDQALADPTWTAAIEQSQPATNLPPAIILDLDETALDTTAYNARLLRANRTHSEEQWQEWIGKAFTPDIPGAVAFLQYAASRNVKVFYITNRADEDHTRRTLDTLGMPLHTEEDAILTRGEKPEWQESDKSVRRKSVASRYRVLLLIGDDLNDFVAASGKTLDQRRALVDSHRVQFGTRWLILPNPVYGSWERSVLDNQTDLPHPEQIRRKIEALHQD